MPAATRPRTADNPIVFAGIFLMFAPIGVLMMMVQSPPPGWVAALVSAAFAGTVSLGWAYSFMTRRFWVLIPTNLFSIFGAHPLFGLADRVGLLEIGTGYEPRTRMIVMAVLCVVLTSVGFSLFVFHLRTAERKTARIVAEIELASGVHANLVPALDIASPLAGVHGRSIASSEMGGDLIDAVARHDRLDVLLGDVSGHGVGAGVVMAMLKASIRTRLLREAELSEVLADANVVLTDLTSANMFATFAAIRLRPGGKLEFALAGHLPIMHFRASENRWEQHPNQSLPLGIDRDEAFVSGQTAASPGDVLVLFTDGLIEVRGSDGCELGLADFAAIVQRCIRPGIALADSHAAITSAVNAHGPQGDDQSLVLVRVA